MARWVWVPARLSVLIRLRWAFLQPPAEVTTKSPSAILPKPPATAQSPLVGGPFPADRVLLPWVNPQLPEAMTPLSRVTSHRPTANSASRSATLAQRADKVPGPWVIER